MLLARSVFRLGQTSLRTSTTCAAQWRTLTSTIVGESGRVYDRREIIYRHYEDESLNIYKAESDGTPFVLKHVPRPIFDLALWLAEDCGDSKHLRIHVDSNLETSTLIYPYFKGTLLALIENDPELPLKERKKVIRAVSEAISTLHHENWIHIDVKPDNILVNWTCNDAGVKTINEVALGDFDIAFKLQDQKEHSSPYAIGNAMWRSPEGQTGSGLTKASDMFSFGLVCIFILGGGDFVILKSYKDIVRRGLMPEQEIVTRQFCYFGPAVEGLLKHVHIEAWREAFASASTVAQRALKAEPELGFKIWGKDIGDEAHNVITGMTQLDPSARWTIDQVLADGWVYTDV